MPPRRGQHEHPLDLGDGAIDGAEGDAARALMGQLISDARKMGYSRVRLGTLAEMEAAQNLYRELGFVRIPRYRADEKLDTVFFELDLTRRP